MGLDHWCAQAFSYIILCISLTQLRNRARIKDLEINLSHVWFVSNSSELMDAAAAAAAAAAGEGGGGGDAAVVTTRSGNNPRVRFHIVRNARI